MSDWPVPGPSSRRHPTLKGCMGALPQMFQWTRLLGSNNKCIATPADVQIPSIANEKQTEIKRLTKQQHRDCLGQFAAAVSNESAIRSLNVWKVCDSSVSQETVGMELRQALHAKQEPFVLQDVIREKRQPMRTPSSRELNFEARPTRRSAKMNHITTSKDQEQATGDGYSAAVVRRNRVPVESMVAMPSHQAPAVGGGHSATKAHSKAASLGRNPVKSPNKRALLMEAAARILEGSNRRTSKWPSTSVRSLLEELDKAKHVKELSKPKEKVARVVDMHSESSEREEVSSPIVVMRAAESKQHQNSYDLKLLGKHNSNSSCKNHFDMSQIVEDLLVMQNRVFPHGNALDEAEVVPSLATPVQNLGSENKSECVQLHDELCSGMKGIQKETMNQFVRGFKSNSSKELLQVKMGAIAIVLPEVIITEDQRPELDYGALLKDSRAIVPSKSIDSPADFFPVMVMDTCLPNFDYRTLSLIRSVLDYALARHFIWGYHATALLPVVSPEKSEGCSVRTTRIEGADETGDTNRSRDKFVEAEKSSVVQLRLCNYSWWASRQNNSPENQLSTEYCAGYGSPVAGRCAYFGKVWNEDMSEEGASGYVYSVDQFQQASPVSVLEPVYEEELELDDSFDNFEEARQKLLEKVRQYEMLAHMDVDTLKKVSEEHASYAWDENELWETDYNYSCSSSSSGVSDGSSQASPAHEFSRGDMEAQDSSRHVMEPYVFSQSLDEQEVEMRPTSSLDCLPEKLEPGPMSCRVQRVGSGDNHMKEVAGKPRFYSGKSVVAYAVNSLIHKDLTMSKWSSSKQEEEEVELELESSFFEVLMWELLSDLLKAQFEPFCNDFDLANPVHNTELLTCYL